uniref:dihydrofolate reductase n=1 Tax=viral metagenome TaxID=1070528 RepID=A0A6C0KV73_9ZZZZ
MNYIIIVACDVNGGIGKDGKLPWYIPPDMKYFKTVTTEAPENTINAVIMGRKTWESLGKKTLPNRLNIVISATLEDSYIPDADAPIIARSFDHAHTKLKEFSNGSGGNYNSSGICKINNVFVIGGESIYKEALYDYRYTKLYITYIYNAYDCDAYFPIHSAELRYKVHMESPEQKTGDNIFYKYFIYHQDQVYPPPLSHPH